MREPSVVNASPLILLTRAGLTDLLRGRADTVCVPRAVASEISAYGEQDPTAIALRETPWLVTVDVDVVPIEIVRWDLGAGESEVLAWAVGHPGTEAIVDDQSGRRCARTLGIPLRGTLGLVLMAKRDGRVPAVRPILDRLRAAGMYLSDRVLNEAAALVDE